MDLIFSGVSVSGGSCSITSGCRRCGTFGGYAIRCRLISTVKLDYTILRASLGDRGRCGAGVLSLHRFIVVTPSLRFSVLGAAVDNDNIRAFFTGCVNGCSSICLSLFIAEVSFV